MKYDSNKKNTFAARLVRIAALFTLIISSGLFVQAQTSPLAAQIERQRHERKRMELNNVVTQVVGGIIGMATDGGKREKSLLGGLQPIVAPPTSSLLTPSANSLVPSLSSLGGISDVPPSVIASATSLSSDQAGGLQNNQPANTNSSLTTSDVQSVQLLNVVVNLGDGTSILKDAAGKFYSVRLAGVSRVGQPTRRRARR